MNWVDVPHVPPYRCSICSNGAEATKIHRPFLVTDFTYAEESPADFREQRPSAELRFTICAVCFEAAATASGSPLAKLIAKARSAPPAPPRTIALGDEAAARIIAAYEEEKEALLRAKVGLTE